MDRATNYIANCIADCVEEKHPYFDIEDEYHEYSSDDEMKSTILDILKSRYYFSDIKEIEIEDPIADHIVCIEIMHNKKTYRFTIEISICSRGYQYLHVLRE
jgi:hypothetical protein